MSFMFITFKIILRGWSELSFPQALTSRYKSRYGLNVNGWGGKFTTHVYPVKK